MKIVITATEMQAFNNLMELIIQQVAPEIAPALLQRREDVHTEHVHITFPEEGGQVLELSDAAVLAMFNVYEPLILGSVAAYKAALPYALEAKQRLAIAQAMLG